MADQERVTIKINVRADTSAIDRVRRKLAELCAQAAACEDTFSDLSDRFDELDKKNRDLTKRIKEHDDALNKHTKTTKDAEKSTDRYNRSNDRLKKGFGGTSKAAGILSGVMKMLKFVMKAALIETLAYAAALSSINILLKAGELMGRGWTSTVKGLGVAAANAAAGVAALAATFAAAMRQFAAAQSVGSYGGQFAAASRGLRAVQGDSQMAVFGVQALTGAFSAASKNARVTGQTVTGLRGLADFAATSGDMEKGLQAAAQVISLLQTGKAAGGNEILSAAQQLGPEFEKSYKQMIEGGKKSNAEIIAAISSGELARQAGIEGAAQTVSGTLVGQLKSFGTQIQVLFGDIGMNFLPQVQEAFEDIRRIIFRTVFQITGNLQAFASGPFVEVLVSAIDKLGMLTAKLFNEYLPKTEEVINNFTNGWRKFTGFFTRGLDKFNKFLNEFSDASAVINEFFREILKSVGGGLSKGFESFSELVLDNKDNLLEFGDALGNIISSFFELTRAIREAFFKALPVINSIVNGLSAIISSLSALISGMASLGAAGAASALALPLLGKAATGKGRIGSAIRGSGAMTGLGGGIAAYSIGSSLGYTMGRQSGTTAGGLIAGGAAGALTGAATGAMIGGPVGAAVGAAVGGIVGGIGAWMGRNRFRREVGDAAGQFAENYSDLVQEQLLSKGYFETAEKKMREFGEIAQNVADGLTESEIFTQESAQQWLREQDKLNTSLARGRGRISDLARITGMTEGEIADLARTMEIDLTDPLLTLQDVMVETGLVVGRFGDEFNAQISGALGEGLAGIRGRQNLLASSKAIDEVTQTFVEAARAGTATDEMRLAVIEQAGIQAMLEGAGDPLRALDYFMQNLGAAGIQLGPGGSLMGFGSELLAGQGQAAVDEFIGAGLSGLLEQIAQNVLTESAALGVAVNRDQLMTALRAMSPDELLAAGLSARNAGFITGGMQPGQISLEDDPNRVALSVVGNTLETLGLTNIGVETLETAGDQLTNFVNDMQANVESPFSDAVTTFDKAVNNLVAGLIDAFGNDREPPRGATQSEIESGRTGGTSGLVRNPDGTYQSQFAPSSSPRPEGDTSTPRSRLMRTLSSHYALSAGVPGSRSITSSLRNFNLGSMSSDHASGQALDLVGNNLGLYQRAMKNAGGYAEFHGGTNNRHLHVVPPHGDSASPAMVGGAGGAGSVYNITVNAAQGMNEEAVAMAVMRKIERQEQMRRERS